MSTPFLPPMGLFAARDALGAASEYLDTIASSLHKSDRVALYTGAYVLYNTAAALANAKIAELQARLDNINATDARRIAIYWSVEDVQVMRPDLDDVQSAEVLQRCKRNHDACNGVNWDVIKYHADELFPKPHNPTV